MSEWQPIETAPKDGRDILIFHPRMGEMFVAYWSDGSNRFMFSTMTALDGGETHWMPLPPAPSRQKEDA